MNRTVRFLIDENDEGTERIVELVDRYGTIEIHRFRHIRSDGQEVWLSIPGCCDGDLHAIRR